MSLFKTNFMKEVEKFLQEQGFTTEMCNIYTRGVDFFESYKRVILCAYKDDLLLSIRARSGEASDPFRGSDDQIEAKLQDPALKLLSCVRSLITGTDPIYCEKFKDKIAIPIIIMEKSSRGHPLYYYYDGEARESKAWYVKKNVVYTPWKWIKEFWNTDFEQSLKDQGSRVKEPIKQEAPSNILETVKEIEEIVGAKRLGILKTINLDKPTLPPIVLKFTQTEQMMIFLIDEPDSEIHPKLMDFAVYYFGQKIERFPSDANAIFFNIDSTKKNESFVRSVIPNDSEFVTKNFDDPKVVETTINGFKHLIDILDIGEFHYIPKLSPISSMDIENLVKTSSAYVFEKVFLEAKKQLKSLFVEQCPFCDQSSIVHKLSDNLVEKLSFNFELTKENSYVVYCDKKKFGCGLGFIVVKDYIQGGVHGFYIGEDFQYQQEAEIARKKLAIEGFSIHSFKHIS